MVDIHNNFYKSEKRVCLKSLGGSERDQSNYLGPSEKVPSVIRLTFAELGPVVGTLPILFHFMSQAQEESEKATLHFRERILKHRKVKQFAKETGHGTQVWAESLD